MRKAVVKMNTVKVQGITLENIKVRETGGYNGVEIYFTIQGNLYNFMIAKTNPPMPLNIIHNFKEKGICPICKRTIYPYPIGNQPCLELKKIDRLLLEKFQSLL
jgi:hypothetical protein